MNLENASLGELRQIAKEQGVKNVSILKKEELLKNKYTKKILPFSK